MEGIRGTMEALADLVQSRMALFEDELKKIPSSRVETVTTLSADFNAFRTFIMTSLAALQRQVDMLAVQCDNLEMKNRKKMLLLHGVTELSDEDASKVAADIVRQHLLDHIQPEDLTQAHCMGVSSSVRPRPILIKFKSYKDRNEAWAAKVGLKGTDITLSEFLTKRRYKLFLDCRDRLGVSNCWTNGGRIKVLGADNKRYSITYHDDLEKVAASQKARCKITEAVPSTDPPSGGAGTPTSPPQNVKPTCSEAHTSLASRQADVFQTPEDSGSSKKKVILACFLAFAAAKPGIVAPVAYTAPVAAAYTAPLAYSAYSAPFAAAPVAAAYSPYAYASPYAYYLRR
ncbi:hypothetical protein evm_010689 [Chilo suppressalis]|nr:hypothetical protein evm_010689 [Chilo suppressalis]